MRPGGLTTRSVRLRSGCVTSGIFDAPWLSDIGRSAWETSGRWPLFIHGGRFVTVDQRVMHDAVPEASERELVVLPESWN